MFQYHPALEASLVLASMMHNQRESLIEIYEKILQPKFEVKEELTDDERIELEDYLGI